VATAYTNTHYIAGIIQKAFSLPGIPFNDETKLASMARAFTQSRRSPLFGCVGALDEFLFRYKSRLIIFLRENTFVENDIMLFLFKLYVILHIGFCSSQGECSIVNVVVY
jgi:hypothetical protein